MAYNPNNSGQIPSNPIVRLVLVILLNIISVVVNKVILLLAFFQFLSHLLTGSVPQWSVRCGEAMSAWTYQMSLFMIYQTERAPFPFQDISSDRD